MELIAYLVLLTTLGIFLQKYLQQNGRSLRLKRQDSYKSKLMPMTILAGGEIGSMVILTSVGAGALGAGLGQLLIGHVEFVLLAILLMGSILGAYIGAKLSAHLLAKIVKNLLAMVLFGVATKLLIAVK